MAEPVIIQVEGLEELLRQFKASNKIVARAIERAMKKATLHLQAKIAVYPPPPPPGYWAAHASPAQKRAFFAKGGWEGRTGTLGRSITSEVRGVGTDEVRGIVGTAIPYAPYVIGPAQAAFHAGRWKMIAEHAEEQKGQIEEFFTEAGQEIVGELAGK